MSVVGFDFGTETCTIAVARRRGIEVLQNDMGKRNTANCVAFVQDHRLLGTRAFSQRTSNYKNTVTNVKRFIGKSFDAPDMKQELLYVPYKVVSADGEVAMECRYEGKQEVFKPEQVSAAMFQKLKKIAENGLDGTRVVDCVIGCPAFWTNKQRRCMLNAAKIAGLNVLRLLNETTAVALQYGILRPLPKDKTQLVLFADLGYSSFDVSLVSFTEGKLNVLATASDHHLGGRSFDRLLFEKLVDEIKGKYKMDVMTNAKAQMKLMKECTRIKKVLSANTKTRYAVEYLMNDKDVNGTFDRDAFEAMAQPLVERLYAPLRKVLAAAKVSAADVHSLEIVGGASRIPMVQSALKEFFGRDLSKTCDGDESVARGCALSCAMLSPSFRVRQFEVHDITPFAVQLQWGDKDAMTDSGADLENATDLFVAGNSTPSIKMVSFKDKTAPFQLVAKYSDLASLPAGTDPVIGRWVVSGMPSEVPAGEKAAKIKVRVRMDEHGVLSVTSAQLLEEIKEVAAPAAAADAPMTDAAPAAAADAADGAAADAAKKEEDKPADKPVDMDTTPEDDKKAADETATPVVPDTATPTPAPEPAKKKKKIKKVDLIVEGDSVGGLDSKTLDSLFERETAMTNADRIVAETNDARNALESYALEMRSRVRDNSDLGNYIDDDTRTKFVSALGEAEDWLYEDGENEKKSVYKAKLTELQQTGNPVQVRKDEAENRGTYVKALKQALGWYHGFVSSKDEKYSHIGPEERKKVQTEIQAADTWLSNELIKQENALKTVDVTLSCSMLEQKQKAVIKKCDPIVTKKKPPPPKKKEAPKEEKPAAGAAAPEADAKTTDEAPAADADAAAPAADTTDAKAETPPAADAAADAAPADETAPMDTK